MVVRLENFQRETLATLTKIHADRKAWQPLYIRYRSCIPLSLPDFSGHCMFQLVLGRSLHGVTYELVILSLCISPYISTYSDADKTMVSDPPRMSSYSVQRMSSMIGIFFKADRRHSVTGTIKSCPYFSHFTMTKNTLLVYLKDEVPVVQQE